MEFSKGHKIRFYLLLAYYKLTSWMECRNLRLKVFTNEFIFLFHSLLKYKKLTSKDSSIIEIKTRFGNFMIRDISVDVTIASPSYERLDLNELILLIDNALQNKHKVLFIDIGASFGKFTISIGNHFKHNAKNLKILSFEPEPMSFRLLNSNVHINRLHNIQTFNIALSDKNGVNKFYYFEPMKQIVSFQTTKSIKIKTAKLDNYLKSVIKNDNVDFFIKLDVEEHEMNVLRGCTKTLKSFLNITLLVEDSMSTKDQKLTKYLLSNGTFLRKVTTYNSFWKLGSSKH